MKAAVYYNTQDVRIEEIPLPGLSDTAGLLLKVTACGLCGSDLRTIKFGHLRVTPPFIIGHEICGQVVDCSAGVESKYPVGTSLAVAPIVYCGACAYCRNGRYEFCEEYREIGQAWPGGFADYLIIPAEALRRGVIHPIPPSLHPVHASLAEPLAACLHAIEHVDFRWVRSAAIFGAGTIGCLLLQLARMRGVEHITIIDPNKTRLDNAGFLNPDGCININTDDSRNMAEDIFAGRKIDLIFTATAAATVQHQALKLASKGGQIVVFSGIPKEQSEICIDFNFIHYRNLRIIGSSIYAPHHHLKALELIANQTIRVKELISTFMLSDFSLGVELALTGKTTKSVFIP